jgi:transposase
VCNGAGKPVALYLTAGQVSDYKGAKELLPILPKAEYFIGDKGYDADWLRKELTQNNIEPCIPPRKNRTEDIHYDKQLYKKRHKIENLFAKIKDWRRIAMRYDRCSHTFLSAIYIASSFIFFLN